MKSSLERSLKKSLKSVMVLASLIGLGMAFSPEVQTARAQPPLPPPPNLEESLKKARVNGKYSMLLAQIAVPGDQALVGDFAEKGQMTTTEYAGFKDLPPGYWVYAAPYWYIWRDQAKNRRSWGPEQLIGEPDTTTFGDVPTSWASKTQDDADEWLLLEYATPVLATGVKVYETYNTGSVIRIAAFSLDGKEETIWAGQETPPQNAIYINQKPFPRAFKTNRVKVYIDSKGVPGWNEIDAVGLTDKDGKTHWATSAECSSTYADPAGKATILTPRGGLEVPDGNPKGLLERLRLLEEDVNELRQRAGLPPRPPQPLPDDPNLDPNVDLLLDFRGALPAAPNVHNAPGVAAPPAPVADPAPAAAQAPPAPALPAAPR